MTVPGRSRWRGWAAALLLLLAALGGIALLRGKDAQPDGATAQSPRQTAPVAAVPQPDPLLDRAALIDAANLAASAFASGESLDDVEATLAGRRFRLILPLGCAGPLAGDAPLDNGWRVDDEGRTLRVAVTRQRWTLAPGGVPAAPTAAGPDAADRADGPAMSDVSGFAIAMPWIRSTACPAASPAAIAGPQPASERESLAIVEPVDPQARDTRPSRPDYRADVRIAADQAPVAGEGLRLRIDGRLAASALPPIICRSEDAGRRPACFLVARFEAIAVTSASGDQVHAEWRN